MGLFDIFRRMRRAGEEQHHEGAGQSGESSFVSTILDFFKDGFPQKAEWSLAELLSYVDYKDRSTPTADEINRAVSVYKKVSLRRDGGEVYFVSVEGGGEAAGDVTAAEVEAAGERYSEEFRKRVKELTRDA